MFLPLPNITYDVQEAIDFANEVRNNFQDLKFTREEISEASNLTQSVQDAQIKSFFEYVGKVEPFISWPREKILKVIASKNIELNGNIDFWFIKDSSTQKNPRKNRQSELQFGFGKKLMDLFPTANSIELVVSPVGTKYGKHVDDADGCIRIIVPIIADDGAVWHVDGVDNITQYPGHMFLLVRDSVHSTEVRGPGERVNIHLLIEASEQDWLTNLKIHL